MTGSNTIRLPVPHAGQQIVLRGRKRHTFLVAGRRWMKTSLACQVAILGALKKERIIWGAPTYDQVRIGFEWIERSTFGVTKSNQSRMEIRFWGGGVIMFRSFDDPENARGHTADGVIMDEAADLHHTVYSAILRPMLMTTQGWSFGIGTPKGMQNWLYQEYAKGLYPEFADYACFQAPSVGAEIVEGELVRKAHPLENPLLPFDEIREMWRTMPERVFRQEILAEFTEDAAGVFRGVRDVSARRFELPEADHQYVFGVDWGRSNDFTVISVIDVTTRRQVFCDRFNQVGWQIQRDRVASAAAKYQPMVIFAEVNAIGSPNIEALQQMGLPVVAFLTTQASKDLIINALALAIERRTISLLADPVQIAELEGYRAERLPSGTFRYGAPEGGHDDTVMALAIALHAADTPSASISYVDAPAPVRAKRELLFGSVSITDEGRAAREYLLGGVE